jgi:ribosomal protein S18 acetylase RimI-like enzyme
MSSNIAIEDESKIRNLSDEDAEAFHRLRMRALTEEPESFGAAAHEEFVDMSILEIAKKIQSSPNSFILGVFQPNLVGMLGFYRRQGSKLRHKGILWGMYVEPENRGQGWGRALVKEVISQTTLLLDVEQLMLSVVTINKAACCLYSSIGFVSYGMEREALKLGEQYLDEDLMVLKL